MQKGTVTILGSGTSQGVPVIACDCNVCKSSSSKDKRTRSSIMISTKDENYVIDSGPDFRQQILRENVKSLKGIIFTHEHKDHVAGLDDVRGFNYREKRKMDVYATAQVEKALRREFHYVFTENSYPGVPKIEVKQIDLNPFQLDKKLTLVPIQVFHHLLPVLGFRFGDFTYITDAKTIADEEKSKIIGTKTLIINALHKFNHVSHFNLEEALQFIEEIKPEKAYLTHISHLFGKHKKIEKELPKNVFLAYDGLKLPFEY